MAQRRYCNLDAFKCYYCVRVKPNKELIVAEELSYLGYSVILPMLDVKRSGVVVTMPLFHSYLFVQVNPVVQSWVPIKYTMFVSYLLSEKVIENEGTREEYHYLVPRKVPSEVINRIRRVAKKDKNNPFVCRLKPGTKVRIKKGPWINTETFVLRTRGEVATILLQLFNMPQEFDFSVYDLEEIRDGLAAQIST
jgi:transcription antitermination factor NusG